MALDLPLQLNIAKRFLDERVSEGRGESVALRCLDRDWTYAQVQALSDGYAGALVRAGVTPEQRVILSMEDGAEYVAGLFGILKAGAVAVMVNPGLPADDIGWFCELARAPAALVDEEAAAKLPTGGPTAIRAGSVEPAKAPFAAYPTHRDDPAIWLFSGGTTGRPKAVVQTHRAFANTTVLYGQRVLALTAEDVTISVPKLYFGYATGSNLFFPFSVGGSAVLFSDKPTPEVLFDLIARFRPTALICVPTLVHRMVDHPEAGSADLSSLRLATSAGEALPPELHARWEEAFGVELLDGLGTAEMWHVFVSNRPGDVVPGTLGKAVPGFEVVIRDDDDRDLPDGEVGRMWVAGDSRALQYWQDSERSEDALRGRWYRSGDLLSKDPADGTFRYCGRADELLKVGGRWVAPQEVEGCLMGHPAVDEVAVVGVADDQGLTKPHAFVVLSSEGAREVSDAQEGGREALAEELKRYVKDRLEPYKYPRVVGFLPELPRTHLGKVDRGRLRRS